MVELGGVISHHGQALLLKAMREDENKDRHEKARPAEAKFIQAGTDLAAAITAMEASLKDTVNPQLKAALEP